MTSDSSGPQLPAGMVSFLFTDIESSTTRWELRPDAMRVALAQHDQLVSTAVVEHGGTIFKHLGDGVGAAFASAPDAVGAAVAAQLALQQAAWPDDDRLKVRMGVHTGPAEPSGEDYFGPTVNRAARVMDVCNGDQVAVSGIVVETVSDVRFVSVGEHRLRGIGTEEVSLLADARLVSDTRALRARVPRRGRQVPPTPMTIVGRTQDITTAGELLESSRLVTIVGPGGVGKTRLAQELARAAAPAYDEAPAYCELADVHDALGVAAVVAGALGARQQPDLDLVESIVNYCDGRRILLVLDNCDHVIDAVCTIVEQVVSSDGPRVLATTRQRLGSPIEQSLPLDPLPAASHGVELFELRARERDPRFTLDEESRQHVTKICELLDGIPGAIEIAAARVRVLSPRQMLGRLEAIFADDGASTGAGLLDTLHQTVRWSYDQLDENDASVFARLSVFAGGFTLEAAEAVCADDGDGDVLDTLLSLVDKSMVVPERGGGRVRFRLLATIRAFGMERLRSTGTDTALRQRHAEYFAAFAAAESQAFLTAKESEVWVHLRQDWSNLRSAFEWLRDTGEVAVASELVTGLGWFATMAMQFEAFDWAAALLAESDGQVLPRRPALLGMAALGAYFVAAPNAQELAEYAVAADPNDSLGLAHGALASVYLNNLHALADSGPVTRVWVDSVRAGDAVAPENRLWALALRVFHLTLNLDPEGAAVAAELGRHADETGSASAIALARWAEGLVFAAERRLDDAEQVWKGGRDIAASLSSQHLVVHLINGLLAHWMAQAAEVSDVLRFCRQALEDAIAQHYLTGTSHLFGVTAIALSRAGAPEVGAALLGAMEANGHVPRDPAVPALRTALGSGFEAAADAGRAWTVDAAGAVALDALNAALGASSPSGSAV